MAKITLLVIGVFFALCNRQGTAQIIYSPFIDKNTNIVHGDTIPEIGRNIRSIVQDKNGNFWFGSEGDGIYRYDGKTVIHYTAQQGLRDNYTRSVLEDTNGNLWFITRDGVCRFNGKSFTDFTDAIKNAGRSDFQYKNGGLFFGHQDGISYFDGQSFTGFTIHPASYHDRPNNMARPYGIYCTYVDRSGNIWFGTESRGVCRYDGKSFSYFTEKGLGDAAVRAIFQDRNGRLWFGNSGFGVFCYDGKSVINFTEEKGLVNSDMVKALQNHSLTGDLSKEATLASIRTINDDTNGEIWIGTHDAGVWRYDGKELHNYTIKDGLPSNSIMTIYKDKKGELWFGTYGEGVYKFNGKTFTKFAVR